MNVIWHKYISNKMHIISKQTKEGGGGANEGKEEKTSGGGKTQLGEINHLFLMKFILG